MGVLDGIRVLDFGRYIAAPFCGALLGDLGAEVIRIDREGGNDDRWVNPVTAKAYVVEGIWPLVRDDDWCGEWKASTPVSISRTQFTPRTVDLPLTAAVATSTAAERAAPVVLAAIVAAGAD